MKTESLNEAVDTIVADIDDRGWWDGKYHLVRNAGTCVALSAGAETGSPVTILADALGLNTDGAMSWTTRHDAAFWALVRWNDAQPDWPTARAALLALKTP